MDIKIQIVGCRAATAAAIFCCSLLVIPETFAWEGCPCFRGSWGLGIKTINCETKQGEIKYTNLFSKIHLSMAPELVGANVLGDSYLLLGEDLLGLYIPSLDYEHPPTCTHFDSYGESEVTELYPDEVEACGKKFNQLCKNAHSQNGPWYPIVPEVFAMPCPCNYGVWNQADRTVECKSKKGKIPGTDYSGDNYSLSQGDGLHIGYRNPTICRQNKEVIMLQHNEIEACGRKFNRKCITPIYPMDESIF